MEAVVWFAVTAMLIAARGRTALVSGARFGKPGFVVAATPDAPVVVTGASFVKVGNQYFDVNTMVEISRAEAARRAIAEGQALP